MKNCKKQGKNLIKSAIFCILALILCFMPFLFNIQIAYAEDDYYSYVLDDLHSDETFSEDDYPIDADDYSLYGITASESSDGELFVYVYQPAQMFEATRVSMSLDEGENYILYNLTFINSSGVFYKYMLSNYTIADSEERTYYISSIYRAWDDEYDGENTENVKELSYKFGLSVTAVGQGLNTVYTMETMEVITVTDMVVANVVGYNTVGKFNWMTMGSNGFCSHVVAFNTDLELDKVYEAECYAGYHYASEVVQYTGSLGYAPDNYIGEEYFKYVTLSYDEVTQVSVRSKSYTFNRIMSVEDYLEAVDIDAVDATLSDYTWILCLSEAEDFTIYSYSGILYSYTEVQGTLIDEATILRLRVDIDGCEYNLGVVSNLQSSIGIVDGVDNLSWLESIIEWIRNNWQYLLYGFLAVIILVIFAPFIPTILSLVGQALVLLLKGIWWCLKKLGKGLWWLITAPFDVVKKE